MVTITLKHLPPQSCVQLTIKAAREQRLFWVPLDYECYFRLLGKYKMIFGIKIYGFCLMPDIVHLIVQPNDVRDVPRFLRDVNDHYTQYFESMHQTDGNILEKDFKILLIRDYHELIHCLNYIEGEPVRSKISKSPVEYLWSSYLYRILDMNYAPKSQGYGGRLLDSVAQARGALVI